MKFVEFIQVSPHILVGQHSLGKSQSELFLHLCGCLQLDLDSGLEGIGHPDGFISKNTLPKNKK